MTDTFSGIVTSDGRKRAFLTDDTLTKVGVPADSKAVGDRFAKAEQATSELKQAMVDETSKLKEDIGNLSSSKISKFYATNNGENHLADSDDGKIADMMVYGKSEQKQYSGRNLMPIFDDFETTVSGVSIKAKNGLITLEGNSIAAIGYSIPLKETITLPDENIYMHLRNNAELTVSSLVFKNENGQVDFASISSINRVLLAPPLTGQPISEIMLSLGEGIAFKGFKMQPSLELTDEATTFEPYTGGKPSPSPDYPQEIKSVVNPTVKVVGKNLLNPLSMKKGQISTDDGKTINEQVNYYHSDYIPMIGTSLSLFYKNYVRWFLYDKNKNFISSDSISAIGEKTVTISECNYIRIHVAGTKVPDNLMIAYGTDASFEPYHEQTVTLPYTLNAIPVASGGNVTIDGQQYIADYVDVERGKLVKMCKEVEYNGDERWELQSVNKNNIVTFRLNDVMALEFKGLSNKLLLQNTVIANTNSEGFYINNIFQLFIRISKNRNISTVTEFKNFLSKNPIRVLLALATPEEIDLTPDQIQAFKSLATNYSVTNIEVSSDQLDGYTVFNYPISMANGWNYVKKQLNDNRDYIYDMDIQSAEAYVNSEYAVALTELEV